MKLTEASRATAATITYIPTPEAYRSRVYHPNVDCIDGHIERRNLGTSNPSKWRTAIQHWFLMHAEEWNILLRPELRIHIGEIRYCIADVSIVDAARRSSPSHPPLIVFEVLSPKDRPSRLKNSRISPPWHSRNLAHEPRQLYLRLLQGRGVGTSGAVCAGGVWDRVCSGENQGFDG